jgi:O-acetyl-ADP-ribose deacetylase (regulator of RNase III)
MPETWQRIACVRGDLTLERADAIVNAANSALAGGGGVDGAIHRAAGPGLLAECRARHPAGCPTGEVRITGGHRLPARHVIHAVGPVWRGGAHGEDERLASCYEGAVELAAREGLASLAFPAISCGAYGFPAERAAAIALRSLARALERHPGVRSVRVVLHSEELRLRFQAALDELGAAT